MSRPRASFTTSPPPHASTSRGDPTTRGTARKRRVPVEDYSANLSTEQIEGLRRQSNLSTLSLSPRRPGTALSGSTATTRPRRTPGFHQGDESSYIIDGEDGAEPCFTLVDRMRNWRNDAMTQHLYGTAEFWGSKVFGLTGRLQLLHCSRARPTSQLTPVKQATRTTPSGWRRPTSSRISTAKQSIFLRPFDRRTPPAHRLQPRPLVASPTPVSPVATSRRNARCGWANGRRLWRWWEGEVHWDPIRAARLQATGESGFVFSSALISVAERACSPSLRPCSSPLRLLISEASSICISAPLI